MDPGYDAGVFKIGNSHIYSKILKDDEGIGLSIQSLPYEKMEDIVVPISIDSKSENISLEVVKNPILKFDILDCLFFEVAIIR